MPLPPATAPSMPVMSRPPLDLPEEAALEKDLLFRRFPSVLLVSQTAFDEKHESKQ